MNLFKSSVYIVGGVVVGWLIAYPTIEYTKIFLEQIHWPLWTMGVIGLYGTFALKFKSLFWFKRFLGF